MGCWKFSGWEGGWWRGKDTFQRQKQELVLGWERRWERGLLEENSSQSCERWWHLPTERPMEGAWDEIGVGVLLAPCDFFFLLWFITCAIYAPRDTLKSHISIGENIAFVLLNLANSLDIVISDSAHFPASVMFCFSSQLKRWTVYLCHFPVPSICGWSSELCFLVIVNSAVVNMNVPASLQWKKGILSQGTKGMGRARGQKTLFNVSHQLSGYSVYFYLVTVPSFSGTARE